MSETEIQLPDTEKLIVSSSPHVRERQDVRRIMLLVVAALAPACLAGVLLFGPRALFVLGVSVAACMLSEVLFCRMMALPSSLKDGSALVTGILLGMNLSAGTPLWMCAVGGVLAIGLGKMIFGGLGYNPFNPALIGRVALLIAFPTALTTWVNPVPGPLAWATGPDAVTGPTPLGTLGLLKAWNAPEILQVGGEPIGYLDLFLGRIGGCIGETSALALLVGGIVLVVFRLIRWQVPVAFIGTVAVVTGAMHMVAPETYAPPLFHILTGGLMLGAIFMATDMVTTPMTASGGIVFGIGCGLLTALIRLWGSYPEGVSFSILCMNALTPLIDRYTGGRPFGAAPKKKEEEA